MSRNATLADGNERLRQLAALDKTTLPPDGGPEFNRLIFASSPYLLQHADNPVDWYQWGEEAFRRAKLEDKPIFLSIGYATCHWCHVMAHESFADPQVAEVLNRHYVAIKVDREERPDIDDQYMAVLQMISGRGGWPMTIIMTGEKKPFFAASYIPKKPAMGMPGLIELLGNVALFWQTQRHKVEENCKAIMASLAELEPALTAMEADLQLEERAFAQLRTMYDVSFGGFGEEPKFPMPHYISFLLRYWRRTGSRKAQEMAENTLTMIRRGGIYDHLGFGIHRYSVDRQWLVPHFEKMLYDQALLSIASIEAFQATGNHCYQEMTEEILDFCLKELADQHGGFCSALDADTEGEEGAFYLWTPAQVRDVLGRDSGELFCRLFDVTERGNFDGRNILHLSSPLEQLARQERLQLDELRLNLPKWRTALLAEREKRIKPLRDTKVLTAWNGLMIAALAKMYGISFDGTYCRAAAEAAGFVEKNLRAADGRLLRSYHLGKGCIPGFLEDYAFHIWGLLELFQATLGPDYLDTATGMAREMLRLFASEDGSFYDSGSDGEKVLFRQRGAYDGALPSGNSIAAMVLLRLGRVLGDSSFLEAARGVVSAFTGNALRQPAGYLQLIMTHELLLMPAFEITLRGDRTCEEMGQMLGCIHKRFIPHLVVRFETGSGGSRPVSGISALVCGAGACHRPVNDAAMLEQLLDELLPA